MNLKTLNKGERATIEYHSRGCFHDLRYRFTLSGDNPSRVGVAWLEEGVECEADLSESELDGLDRLLQYWRTSDGDRGPAGTTDSSVTVTWTLVGSNFAEEFVHASPPLGLSSHYWAFFLGKVTRCFREHQRQVRESRVASFQRWALDSYDLKDLRFLEDSIMCVMLRESNTQEPTETRHLAYELSKEWAHVTGDEAATCRVYDANRQVTEFTFKK